MPRLAGLTLPGRWPILSAAAASRLSRFSARQVAVAVQQGLARGVDATEVIHLDDDDLHFVAHADDVFDLVDAVVGQLGDVHQGVLTRHHLDERAEGQDADDFAGVDLARLDVASHRGDAIKRRLSRGLVDGGDEDRTVVLDGDLGAGLVLQGTDVAAARADQLADLVLRHVDAQDARRVRRHLLTRRPDALGHHIHDLQTSVSGLFERAAEDLEVNALDLDVHLQRRHAVARAGDFEVHVAEVVFHADDIGQDGQVVALFDQAHGDAGDRRLDRDAGVHHREHRSADRGHRGGSVGGEHLGDDPNRVGELFERRQDGGHGPLAEHAVADAAPRRVAHAAGLAGREGREVVVMHEALRVLGREVVETLGHAGAGQRGEAEHLGLTALEQAGAVRAGNEVDLGRERAQVGVAPTVRSNAVVKDAASDDALLQRVERFGVPIGVGIGVEVLQQRRFHGRAAAVAVGLVLGVAQR